MKNLFIFFISIIISLLFCEILLRYVFINDQLKLRINANKKQFKDFQKLTWNLESYSFIPNSKGEVNHPEYNYIINHDQIGFRNPCFLSKNKNIKNIILGDSFVYGVGVQDDDTLNCQIKSDNYTFAVPNSSPNCYYQIFRHHYPNLKQILKIKKVVNIHVIFYIGNDFEGLINLDEACPSEKINDIKLGKKNLKNKLNYIITKGFLSDFYLPQVPKIFYKNYLNKKKYQNINSVNNKYFFDNGNDTFYTDINHINQNKLKNSLNTLNIELQKIDLKNLNIIFYLLPSASDISKKRLVRKSKISGFDYKIINTEIKYESIIKSCKKLKISCYDLRNFFTDKNFYYHDTHLNAEGVKILSKIIDEYVK
jgi:hypothetical protein